MARAFHCYSLCRGIMLGDHVSETLSMFHYDGVQVKGHNGTKERITVTGAFATSLTCRVMALQMSFPSVDSYRTVGHQSLARGLRRQLCRGVSRHP